jgi:putative polyhydroxyalkanoate system protein
MPKVHIEQAHALSREEAKKRVVQVLADREAAEHGITSRWASPFELELTATGATGRLLIEDKSVVVNLDLSLLLWPVKGRIESELREGLRQALA